MKYLSLSLALLFFSVLASAQTKKDVGGDSEASGALKDNSRAVLLFIERNYNDLSGEELTAERDRVESFGKQLESLEKKQPAAPDCMSEYCDNIYFAKVNVEKANILLDNKELNPNFREMILPLSKGEEFVLAKAHVGLNTYAIDNYKTKIEKGGEYGILISKMQETLVRALTYINGEVKPEQGAETDLIRSIVESNLSLRSL